MTPDNKQALSMLRSALRAIASVAGADHPYWGYIAHIDAILETGKCTIADNAEALIDLLAEELVAFTEAMKKKSEKQCTPE